MKAYFAPDGSYGDAKGLVIVELSDDNMGTLFDEELTDDERYQLALLVKRKIVIR